VRSLIVMGMIAAGALCFAGSVRAQAQEEGTKPFELEANIRYYYGDWDLGDFDMDPIYGMIGPKVTAWFFDHSLSLSFEYITGDFEGDDRLDIPTAPEFQSHKDYDHETRREDLNVLVGYNVFENITLFAGYKYIEYDFTGLVKFNSNIREYGSGEENLKVNGKAFQFGAQIAHQVVDRLTLTGRGFYVPQLETEAEGVFRYQFTTGEMDIEEEWQDNDEAEGFRLAAQLTYDLPEHPVSFSLGYAFQQFEADDPGDTWFDRYTRTVNPGNSFPEDRFMGGFFDVKFRF
jgi:hypothetical protein